MSTAKPGDLEAVLRVSDLGRCVPKQLRIPTSQRPVKPKERLPGFVRFRGLGVQTLTTTQEGFEPCAPCCLRTAFGNLRQPWCSDGASLPKTDGSGEA